MLSVVLFICSAILTGLAFFLAPNERDSRNIKIQKYTYFGLFFLAWFCGSIYNLYIEDQKKDTKWHPSGIHNSYIKSLSKWIPDNKRVEGYARPVVGIGLRTSG